MYKYILAVILSLLAVGLVSAKKAAPDEMEARGDGIVVRIAGTKCTNKKVLEQLDPQYHKDFRKAEILTNGKKVGACWIADVNGVFIMGEDGNQGIVPLQIFKPVEVI